MQLSGCICILLQAALLCNPACALSPFGRPTEVGSGGMVACTQTLACDEGTKVLEAGGNALEAAIAIQLALAVVEPQHVSLLGGGGLMMKAPGKPARFLDFREEAPAAYHPKTFCKGVQCWKDGDPTCSCEGGADTNGCSGGQTFGVPGVPAMIMRLYEDKLVTRPLRELAAGALRLAREGFPMYDFLYSQIVDKQHLLCWNAAATEVFLTPDCTMPKVAVNDTFQQPWLAETLEKYFQSPETLAAFYHGDMAHTLVEAARNAKNPETGVSKTCDVQLPCTRWFVVQHLWCNYAVLGPAYHESHSEAARIH